MSSSGDASTLSQHDWTGKCNQVFVIDARLRLYKIRLDKDSTILMNINLSELSLPLREALEANLRGKDFARISISDRDITLGGKTYGLQNGYQWNFKVTGFPGQK